MNTIIANPGDEIARCIRRERDARGWAMAELAERSGVSKAAISKIERGEMSPTAVILLRLASAFDLTLAGLLLKAEGRAPGQRLSRAGEQPIWRDPDTGYVRRQVFSQSDHPVELVQVQLPAGQRVVLPASSYHRIRQILWVRSGELVVHEGGERFALRPGDCLGFGPPSEVTIANEGAGPCAYVVTLART
jgi:transcriptional regulator with XRE-family HTH domain